MEQRYRHMAIYRNCISERKFNKLLPKKIQSLEWEQFGLQLGAASIFLVKEFYANAKEHVSFKVFVRRF